MLGRIFIYLAYFRFDDSSVYKLLKCMNPIERIATTAMDGPAPLAGPSLRTKKCIAFREESGGQGNLLGNAALLSFN